MRDPDQALKLAYYRLIYRALQLWVAQVRAFSKVALDALLRERLVSRSQTAVSGGQLANGHDIVDDVHQGVPATDLQQCNAEAVERQVANARRFDFRIQAKRRCIKVERFEVEARAYVKALQAVTEVFLANGRGIGEVG
ncbi:hypothetical protein RRF57_004933 [Xylaria bambusicola]|uniref:Uncharacterized protein n=1 Tax=Xylaria bambusicola TaxID=326684 RepID=A0AAN7UH55_9PEZI